MKDVLYDRSDFSVKILVTEYMNYEFGSVNNALQQDPEVLHEIYVAQKIQGLDIPVLDIHGNEVPAPNPAEIAKKEQKILEEEFTISKIRLTPEGKILNLLSDSDLRVADWKDKRGIIDVQSYDGCLVVVYNANLYIPEGCPDLRKPGSNGTPSSGQYDPDQKICFVDLSNSYSYLDEVYHSEWLENYVRHELRHHIVMTQDEKYKKETGKLALRNVEWELLNKENKDAARQLAYLDELHSQYFDVIEGNIEGVSSFRGINSEFYSVAGKGPHKEIASENQDQQLLCEELFYHLQGYILAIRMTEGFSDPILVSQIRELAYAAGGTLATARNIGDALKEVRTIWGKLLNTGSYKEKIIPFLENYKPTLSDNTPVITPSLLRNII